MAKRAVLHKVDFKQRNDGDCNGVECQPFGVMKTVLDTDEDGKFYSRERTEEELAEAAKCKGHPQTWLICSCGYEELLERYRASNPFGQKFHGGIRMGDEHAMEAISLSDKGHRWKHREYEHIMQSLMETVIELEARLAIESAPPIDENE